MEKIDIINNVLKEFGDSIALSNLSIKEENGCVLCVDGVQSIQLIYNKQCNTLDFISEVGVSPEEDAFKCFGFLLKANAEWEITQGLTLAKQNDKNSILLGYQLPILNLSLSIFEKYFDQFLQQVETWKSYLIQLGHGEVPEVLAAY